jgi:putative ABC transport system ATP-binding protein
MGNDMRAAAAKPLVFAKDLGKQYVTGDFTLSVLDGVDVTVSQGELVAIVGPAGSGKSTLLNVLACLDRPTSGTYHLDGREVSRLCHEDVVSVRSDTVGVVVRDFDPRMRTSLIETVELPLEYAGVARAERGMRARKALERVGLGRRVDHGSPWLSPEESRRARVACAIANEPKVLFADEPTENLDPANTMGIMRLLQELWLDGMTIVFVTQEPALATYASRVLVLRDGRLVSDDEQFAVVAGGAA